ncbi:MAG: hypothetical protein J0L52_01475 [Caulobacterales bacterium]|nr:hypothetical protein [Caulobacterales bacterium]
MRRLLFAVLPLLALAGPARAEDRFFAYDPANDAARLMTRGITLRAERGLFGAVRAERLFSTVGAGSAGLVSDTLPDGTRGVLPDGSEESNVYRIEAEGNGAALGRVLCPGASTVWLVMGRIRPTRDLTIHAVGQGAGGQVLLCRTMAYHYRGEWAVPPGRPPTDPGAPPPL